jgi:hypothetical protein
MCMAGMPEVEEDKRKGDARGRRLSRSEVHDEDEDDEDGMVVTVWLCT